MVVDLSTTTKKSEMAHFDYQRNDGYQTKIDAGFEDLDLQKDAAKIMLYM